MFFVCGVMQGNQSFDWFTQTVVCPRCGAYGRYRVSMTYSYLMLFFIPVFKWNRRYWVDSSCCGGIYALSPEKGERIARREETHIEQTDLTPINGQFHRCPSCGATLTERTAFCPHCGTKL